MSRMFRLIDPDLFIKEFNEGVPRYRNASHDLLISQIDFEVLFHTSGGSHLAEFERVAIIEKYQEARKLVKDDYKKITGVDYPHE